jgi:hypothetical protein
MAFWRPRSESREEWAARAETFFRLLAGCHPSYTLVRVGAHGRGGAAAASGSRYKGDGREFYRIEVRTALVFRRPLRRHTYVSLRTREHR